MKIQTVVKQLTLLGIMVLGLFLGGCTTTESEEGADTASSQRECRTQKTQGSKMRRSICMTTEEWAEVDRQQTQALAEQANTDDVLRRTQDYNTQNSVSPGDAYNPYPGY